MHENCKHFEYLVVIDSDGIISEIDDSNISSFPNINWHALAANVRGYYYDVWLFEQTRGVIMTAGEDIKILFKWVWQNTNPTEILYGGQQLD